MARKCKDCPDTKERRRIENVEASRELKTYSFPTLGIKVQAKNLEDAQKQVKAILETQTKSIE